MCANNIFWRQGEGDISTDGLRFLIDKVSLIDHQTEDLNRIFFSILEDDTKELLFCFPGVHALFASLA